MNREQAVTTLFTDDGVFGSVLFVAFLDACGPEGLQWAPGTIRYEFNRHYNVELSETIFDRLMAMIAVVTTDLFFKRAAHFAQLCTVLNGATLEHIPHSPLTAMDLAWGCTEALLMQPPDPDEPEPFAPDIQQLIGYVLKDEGFVSAPDILRIAGGNETAAQNVADYHDDPEMMEMITAVQTDKRTAVETGIKTSLAELMRQLQLLPLEHGNIKALGERLQKRIPFFA